MPPVAAKQRNALTRKLGPLPAWAWALITGGAIYLYRSRSSGGGAAATDVASYPPSGVNPDTGLPWNIDPETGAPYGAGGGGTTSTADTTSPDTTGADTTGSDDGGTTSGSLPAGKGAIATAVGTILGKPKRPRKKKPKVPTHGHKGRPPKHHKPPKRKKKGPGSRPARDRATIPAAAGTINDRASSAKAALSASRAIAPASAVAGTRTSSATVAAFRSYSGTSPAPSAAPRPASVPATPRVAAVRTLAVTQKPAVPRPVS